MGANNSVTLIGRLTRDVQEPTNNGPARFSIAVDRRKKEGDEWKTEAQFFDVEYWHRSIIQYLVKGKEIAVSGELRQDRWEQDGQPRSKVVVSATDIQFTHGSPKDAQGAQGGARTQSDAKGHGEDRARAATPQGAYNQRETSGEFTDDIPF